MPSKGSVGLRSEAPLSLSRFAPDPEINQFSATYFAAMGSKQSDHGLKPLI